MKTGMVLVINQREERALTLHQYLEEAGFAVLAVGDYEEAKTFIQELRNLGLVILDTNVNNVGWAPLLRSLKKQHPEAAVVVSSETPDRQTVTQAFDEGAVDFLMPPFQKEKVLDIVDCATRRGAMMR